MLTDWNAPTYEKFPHPTVPHVRKRVVFTVTHKTNPALNFTYEEANVFDVTEAGLQQLIYQQLAQRDRIIDGDQALPPTGTLDLTPLFPKDDPGPTPEADAAQAFSELVVALVTVKAILAGALDPAVTLDTYTAAYDRVREAYAAASPTARPLLQRIWAAQHTAAIFTGVKG